MTAEAPQFGHQRPQGAPLVAVPVHVPARLSLGHLRRLAPLLRASEVFALLGISRSTGYAWIRQGFIPTVEVGGCSWVPTAVLAERLFGIPADLLLGPAEGDEH